MCYEHGVGVERNWAAARTWYCEAASRGHARAQYRLAIYFEHGWMVTRDRAMAFKWYTRAADQGDTDAQYRLGMCYEEGLDRI